ncbi:MAG: 5'/3'-nucleotidase SurE [Prevotellaceae bacterium]|jgi:5'-nucleotidase|nr:5'/3'-nucleotidase SurE [Prevotellaceae bacterium]
MSKPLILITNDDGIDANGIKVLTDLMLSVGEVVVVAPDGARSGMSNAITSTLPLRYKLLEKRAGLQRFVCTGTPTDCVKIASHAILDKKPDLLVSGINHGSNAAINLIYSGTMGAAFEGCENHIPSIGFSLDDYDENADFEHFKPYILKITKMVLEKGLPERVCLNVNAPTGAIKGIKTARQSRGYWTEEFENKTDPHGNKYFWMTGYFKNEEPQATDTDEFALKNGYVSIVPTSIDMTAYKMIDEIKMWNL